MIVDDLDGAAALAQVGLVPARPAPAFHHHPIRQPIVCAAALANPLLPEVKASLT